MMGMIKAELSKIANILEKTYIRQLELTKSQAIKRAQIKIARYHQSCNKEGSYEIEAYISNQIEVHAYHLTLKH
jgi:hypothetical protein